MEKLSAMKPTHIRIVLIIAAVIMIIGNPLLPTKVEAETKRFYQMIENIPPGGLIVDNVDFSIANWGGEGAIAEAVTYHVLSRPVKVIFTSVEAAEVSWALSVIEGLMKNFPEREYGVDWVFMGFVPGEDIGFAPFFKNTRTIYTEDFYGTPISQLEIWDGVNDASDWDLFIENKGGTLAQGYIVRQLTTTYPETPYIAWDAVTNYPTILPYRQAGQIDSLLAAEIHGPQYEFLIGRSGLGATMSNVIGSMLFTIFILTIIGNIAEFMSKRVKRGE